MSLYLDIAKKVTVDDTQRPSPADRECGRGVNIEPHTLTPALLAAVKCCKAELLEVLKSPSLSTVGSLISPNAPGTQASSVETLAQTSADGDSYADREWRRFLACAVSTPNGLGLYDPSESPEMPSGITGEQWDTFVADCGRLGGGSRT
ncbi:MAG: hypothetical protein IID34_11730 [Planctomycetes bacterium]|nr:hypothetical protein [Planctomycetota bacterium]